MPPRAGLRVALVERADFGSGTSSRSTKLVHGGVRYLEQAVKRIDRSQFRLVREALRERQALLELAPHLVHELPIFVPLYQLGQHPYYRIGLRLYDRLAGKYSLHRSEFVPREHVMTRFPYLREEVRGHGPPRRLRGGVVYHDGQFDDARMNLALALTAAEQGAAVANYVTVEGFTTDARGPHHRRGGTRPAYRQRLADPRARGAERRRSLRRRPARARRGDQRSAVAGQRRHPPGTWPAFPRRPTPGS